MKAEENWGSSFPETDSKENWIDVFGEKILQFSLDKMGFRKTEFTHCMTIRDRSSFSFQFSDR